MLLKQFTCIINRTYIPSHFKRMLNARVNSLVMVKAILPTCQNDAYRAGVQRQLRIFAVCDFPLLTNISKSVFDFMFPRILTLTSSTKEWWISVPR